MKLMCTFCKKEFEKSESFINSELKKNKNHKFYCSRKCVYDDRRILERVKVNCTFCKKECTTDENDLKRNKNFYCSVECYNNYRKIPLEQRREMVELECPICRNKFKKFKNSYEKGLRYNQKNFYCSKKCQIEASRNDYSKEFLVKCVGCGKEIIRTGRHLKITKQSYCTPSCRYTHYHRINATGEHRSLLEKKIEQHIKNSYPNLKYITNDKEQMEGLELDFYFPIINLAIEINGPAHFNIIWDEKTLKRIQRNDRRKFYLCNKKNIRLIVIKDVLDYSNKFDNSFEIFKKYINPLILGCYKNE